MKKFLNIFISKRFILVLTFLINLALFFAITYFLDSFIYSAISIFATIVAVIILINSEEQLVYKFMWLLSIAIFPLFGTVLYLYLKRCRATLKKRNQFNQINERNNKFISKNEDVLNEMKLLNNGQQNLAEYLINTTNMPVYKNTSVKYLKNGEEYFEHLLKDLKTAERYIFLEYYIIEHGKIWDQILEVLKEKANNGVEIKILYDDFGCMDKISRKYFKDLTRFNIEIVLFNKCISTINKYSQFRDHRKLCVIDGKIGFVGGINLADEYANITTKFGYWKDTGIRLEGEAVWSLIVLFSNNWQLEGKSFDLEKYKIEFKIQNNSYIQTFGSGPLNMEPIARNNYINLISSAKKYVYITTPYLLLDTTTVDALTIAAKSGVDVKIVMPGIPDKRFVWYLGRSYYKELVNAGVKIYEFTPGFIHSKMVVVDDVSACVGTINFDFRSLYLNFENAIMIYNDKEILNIKDDIVNIVDKSKEITKEGIKRRKWYEKFVANMLRFLVPLM